MFHNLYCTTSDGCQSSAFSKFCKIPLSFQLKNTSKIRQVFLFVDDFVFRAFLVRLLPDFNNHAFGYCVFSRARRSPPPKSEACPAVRLSGHFCLENNKETRDHNDKFAMI